MPVLIIGGEGSPQKKPEISAFMRKSKGGIGGKFMNDTSDGEPQDAPSSSETDARKLEAGKLLLRAIKADDPQLTAEAVATLAECASESGDDAGSEDDTEA